MPRAKVGCLTEPPRRPSVGTAVNHIFQMSMWWLPKVTLLINPEQGQLWPSDFRAGAPRMRELGARDELVLAALGTAPGEDSVTQHVKSPGKTHRPNLYRW